MTEYSFSRSVFVRELMRSSAIAPIIAFVVSLATVRSAAGHAFIQRYELPLPLWYYLVGAGLVVALTFVFLANIRGNRARQPAKGLNISRTFIGKCLTSNLIKQITSILSVLLFVFLISAGIFGIQTDPFQNILPTFIWVGWWVGFAFICALVGNAWPAVNPWAVVARFIENFMRRENLQPLPEWLGVWPAVVLFISFAWAELVWPNKAMPASLAWAILLYSTITWAAMVKYGTNRWLTCGESFSLIFELFGRFAPIALDRNGQLVIRPYGAGLLGSEKVSGSMVVFVITLLATVSFDGFIHTPLWRRLFHTVFDAFYDLGITNILGNTGAYTMIVTAGLMVAPLFFLAIFVATCALTAVLSSTNYTTRPRTFEVARSYSLTLIPIAIVYHLTHYLSLLMIEGQRFFALASDPFGVGWNLFGTANFTPDIALIDSRFLWLFSVIAIITGHIVAVRLAHITALHLCKDRKTAIVSQFLMLVLMISYTMLSLWILAQPIVKV